MDRKARHVAQRVVLPFLRKQLYLAQTNISHTFNNIRRNKVNYSLGFAACFLVVFVVALVVTIIGNTPVVFLRLAEMQVGEIDMKITPGDWTGSKYFNYSLVSSILQGEQQYSYHAPRLQFMGTSISTKSCDSTVSPDENHWKYHNANNGTCFNTCFKSHCRGSEYTSTIFVMDSDKEKAMGLGREWNRPRLASNRVYMQSSLAGAVGAQIGDTVFIKIWAGDVDILGAIWQNANRRAMAQGSDGVPPLLSPIVYLTVVVEDIFSDVQGKYDSSLKNGVIFEYSSFMQLVAAQMDQNVDSRSKDYLRNLNLYEYAGSILFNLPPPRIDNYITSNTDTIQYNIVQFASQILYRIGFNLAQSSLPVLNNLSSSRFVSLFLGLILNVIIFILLFLSIILIYSLLMINVETRTFEMGVLRMIGAKRSGIVQLLLYQAFSYSLPSWVVGLVLAQLFALLVVQWFQDLTGVPISPLLTSDSVLLATGLGILIPVVSSIFPIRNALGQNLHDSLDAKRSKASAVKITIERSEDNSFSSSVIVIGVCLAVFGFGIYYIFPLSLLSFNLSLLLNMFFFLLIGMLLGMVLLSLNIEHIIERIIVFVFFFWEKSAVPQVVLKNLIAHRLRNRKTSIMYALSLGFIIFINVAYEMQMQTLTYQAEQENGSFLRLSASGYAEDGLPNRITIIRELEELADINPTLAGYSWISAPLASLNVNITSTEISNIGHVFRDSVQIYAASPNLFEVALPGFLNVREIAEDPDISLGDDDAVLQQLYTEEGSKSMVLGTTYIDKLGLSFKDHSHLLLNTNYKSESTSVFSAGPQVQRTRLKPMAFIDSAPIFKMSQYPSVTSQDVIVSFTSFVRLSNGVVPSVDAIPMLWFLIQLQEGATGAEIDTLKAQLEALIPEGAAMSVWDYRDQSSPLDSASEVISYFFDFTTVVAMAISFFSLMSSMFTNVYEQTKEIGILRAIGIPKFWVFRIYIYEAFVLVFSSSLLGMLIGTLVGFTVVLQRVLFTQLPIPFVFPWSILLLVFACSVVFSFLASFGPTRAVLGYSIVSILRGGN